MHDAQDTIYLEVDDLLDYLRSHWTVSGIQRVQVGIILHAIMEPATDQGTYALVRTGRNASGFRQLDPSDLLSIINYIEQSPVSQARLLSMIEGAEQRVVPVESISGQLYFVLGAL